MATTLQQVEDIRREVVKRLEELTGLDATSIQVDICFHDQSPDSQLIAAARQLGWYERSDPLFLCTLDDATGTTMVYRAKRVIKYKDE